MNKKKQKIYRKIKKRKSKIQLTKFGRKVTLNRNKVVLSIGVAVLVTLFVLSGVTYAWFTASDSIENKFKGGFDYRVELIDSFDPPKKLEFNQTYEKLVSVKNTGDIPAFARVLVFTEIKKENGVILPMDEKIEVRYNFTTPSDWILGEDGFYYYTKLIKPNTETSILFDKVTFFIKDEIVFDEMYDNANVSIDVKLESIDARNNEYRFSWWQDRENPPTEERLSKIDGLLQKEKRGVSR